MRALGATAVFVISCVIGAQSLCPRDSVATEDGGCKCVSPCPPNKCKAGQRPVQVRAAVPESPGSCCPLYDCVPSELISWVDTDDGQLARRCIDDSGIPRRPGERWHQSPCVNCTCEEINGVESVSCHASMCQSCEKPAPPVSGECCPHCLERGNDTESTTGSSLSTGSCDSLQDCESPCYLTAADDPNACPTCQCPNDAESTANPDLSNKICPKLPHCGLNCKLGKDQGGCSVCACHDDVITTLPVNVDEKDDGIICPKLNCDLHCEHGLVMDNDDCTFCQCKPQAQVCPHFSGCKKKCPYGYKLNKRGCLTCRCRATCLDHRNDTHPEGSSWNPDACTSCTCDNVGRLACKETVCSVACSNPLPPLPGSCCPICPINEILGRNEGSQSSRGWGIVPITVIAVLTCLCIILMVFVARGRFRGRLTPSTTLYTSYPAQYYKCVPAYETPVHQNEKIVPL